MRSDHRDEQVVRDGREDLPLSATTGARYVSAGPTFVFLHPTFHLIALLRAGWRRPRLPRVRHRRRLELARRQGVPALPRRPDGEAGRPDLQQVQQAGRCVLTLHVLSDPITDSAFPLSPPARTRSASASGARTRTSSPGASPSTRRTPSPTSASRCAGRAPAPRCASTHLRFTPPYFPTLTLLVALRSRNGSGTNALSAANATRKSGGTPRSSRGRTARPLRSARPCYIKEAAQIKKETQEA